MNIAIGMTDDAKTQQLMFKINSDRSRSPDTINDDSFGVENQMSCPAYSHRVGYGTCFFQCLNAV